MIRLKPTKYRKLNAEACIRKYRRETWLTAGTAIVLVVLIAAVFLMNVEELSLWLYLLLIFLILLIYYVSTVRRALGLYDILYTDCDPVKFLEILRGLQKKSRKRSVLNMLHLQCATTLCYLEDWDGVYSELAAFRAGLCRNRKLLYIHLNLLGDYCLIKDQREDFEACRTQLLTLAENGKAGEKKLVSQILQIWDRRIACLKQDREQEREILNSLLSQKKYLIQEVNWRFRLAQLDLLAGEDEQAREGMQFVMKYGNTLAVREWAQKILEGTGVINNGNDTE